MRRALVALLVCCAVLFAASTITLTQLRAPAGAALPSVLVFDDRGKATVARVGANITLTKDAQGWMLNAAAPPVVNPAPIISAVFPPEGTGTVALPAGWKSFLLFRNGQLLAPFAADGVTSWDYSVAGNTITLSADQAAVAGDVYTLMVWPATTQIAVNSWSDCAGATGPSSDCTGLAYFQATFPDGSAKDFVAAPPDANTRAAIARNAGGNWTAAYK